MGQDPVPLVNIKIGGTWCSSAPNWLAIGCDPWPHLLLFPAPWSHPSNLSRPLHVRVQQAQLPQLRQDLAVPSSARSSGALFGATQRDTTHFWGPPILTKGTLPITEPKGTRHPTLTNSPPKQGYTNSWVAGSHFLGVTLPISWVPF